MPLRVELVKQGKSKALRTSTPFGADRELLNTVPYMAGESKWKTINMVTAATEILVTPPVEGSVAITDILMSSDKTNATSVAIRFTDGTNVENIFKGDSTNAPIQIAHSFTGLLFGWKDARIDIETVGAVDATITVAYVRIPDGLEFADWDALR